MACRVHAPDSRSAAAGRGSSARSPPVPLSVRARQTEVLAIDLAAVVLGEFGLHHHRTEQTLSELAAVAEAAVLARLEIEMSPVL